MSDQTEKTATQNYIITFYRDVEMLRHWVATYTNLTVEIDVKFQGNFENMSHQDKSSIQEAVNSIRYYAQLTFYQLKALIENKKNNIVPQDLKKCYDKIESTYIVPLDDAKEYIFLMNKQLMNYLSYLNMSTEDILQQYDK